MDPKLDNPAARLHSILSKVRGETDTESMRDVWARALDMEGASLNNLLAALGRVYTLPEEVSHNMKLIPGYHERDVSRWWNDLSRAFLKLHLEQIWRNVSNQLSNEVLEDIESCSHKLAVFIHDPHLTEDQLDYIAEQVQFIRAELSRADEFDETLKRRIEFRLKRIEDALQMVHITGTTSIQVELEATTATVAAEAQKAEHSEETKKALGGLSWVLTTVLTIMQIWNLAQRDPALPFAPDAQPPVSDTLPPNRENLDDDRKRWILPNPPEDLTPKPELETSES